VGNPDLKAAQAWNYEVNVALYDGRFGLFSVSAFYKDIKNMYHQINGAFFDAASADSLFDRLGINVTSPFQNEGFALTYPYNSSKPTRVWGVEIEHQANFLFLPGVLRNLVLTYNLSFIRSETYIPGTQTEEYCEEILPGICVPKLRYHFVERKHKLERQPDFLSNVAIGYDYRGFSARLSMFHQGEFNTRFSPNGRDDRVVKSFTRWDLALRQQIRPNLYVLLNVNNLTNVEEGTIVLNRVQGWRLPNDREIYGTTVDFGLRLVL
jgi:outer membrane receptor protein involved in Fe transport